PLPVPEGGGVLQHRRAPAARRAARLLPRVHGAHARFTRPWRAAHHHRRRKPAVLLHTGPLRDVPPGGHTAMSARAKSPPAATRPTPKAWSGAGHPPLGGGAGATHPADESMSARAKSPPAVTHPADDQ